MDASPNQIPFPPEELEFPARLASIAIESETRPHSDLEAVVIRLFDQFQGRVFTYVLTYGLSHHDAEDVVQETFFSLFRHLQLGRPRTNLNGWLFRVAHNLALKRRVSSQAFARTQVNESVLSQHPCERANAEEQFSFHQRTRLLRAVVDALPEQDQRCLYLRAEGLKYRQIADVLGISLGGVSLSLARSLARIMRATGSR